MNGIITLKEPLKLESGRWLSPVRVAYSMSGEPNETSNNVVIVCHTLTGGINIYEQKEWWFVKPKQWIDSDQYCILSLEVLGGWRGSSSPKNHVSDAGRKTSSDFPTVTVTDSVRAHIKALEHLNISRVRAIVGGSFGGFCVYTWLALAPRLINIAYIFQSAPRCSAHTIGLFSLMRELIVNDPNWNASKDEGREDSAPSKNISQAIALNRLFQFSHYFFEKKLPFKYRQDTVSLDAMYWEQFCNVDTFVNQPPKALAGLDTRCLLSILRSSSLFDLERSFPDLWERWNHLKTSIIHIPCRQDWRYPAEDMQTFHESCLQHKVHSVLKITDSPYGHGSFLHDPSSLDPLLAFLNSSLQAGRIEA